MRGWQLVLASLALFAAGCAEELGPEPMRTTSVRGVIMDGGRIVVRGWIEFHPVAETVGNLRVAPIRPDGSYEVTGVAVGRNLILVDYFSTDANGPAPLTRKRGCVRRIPDGASTTVDLDTLEEWMKRQQSRQ